MILAPSVSHWICSFFSTDKNDGTLPWRSWSNRRDASTFRTYLAASPSQSPSVARTLGFGYILVPLFEISVRTSQLPGPERLRYLNLRLQHWISRISGSSLDQFRRSSALDLVSVHEPGQLSQDGLKTTNEKTSPSFSLLLWL